MDFFSVINFPTNDHSTQNQQKQATRHTIDDGSLASTKILTHVDFTWH